MLAQLFNDVVLQLGVGGIFAILIIRMVFDFLNRRNGSSNTKVFDKRIVHLEQNIDDIKINVNKIHDMHDVKDGDGVPVWYIPRSWAEMQERNMDTNLKITALLRDLTKTVDRLDKNLSAIRKELK